MIGSHGSFLHTPCLHIHSLSHNLLPPPERDICKQPVNMYGHIIITQCPQFTLGFVPGSVHFVGLDNCIMIYIHHYGSVQSILSVLFPSLPHLIIPTLPALQTHGKHSSFSFFLFFFFYYLHNVAVSRMSYDWNCTVCSLFRLASFT